jgi:hypothetical protein
VREHAHIEFPEVGAEGLREERELLVTHGAAQHVHVQGIVRGGHRRRDRPPRSRASPAECLAGADPGALLGCRDREGSGEERGEPAARRCRRAEALALRTGADSARVDPDDVEPVQQGTGLGWVFSELERGGLGCLTRSARVDEQGADTVSRILRLDLQQPHLDFGVVPIVVVHRELRSGALGDLLACRPVQVGRGYLIR